MPVPLDSLSWRSALADACRACERKSGAVMVCLAGPAGAGKTTLGREIRKKGLPGFARREVVLIDDGVMSVPVLGVFTRRIKDKSGRRDNLAAFSRWTAGKSVVVYIAIRPWERLESCDVLVRVECPDEERARRQALRGKSNAAGGSVGPADWARAARVLDLATA